MIQRWSSVVRRRRLSERRQRNNSCLAFETLRNRKKHHPMSGNEVAQSPGGQASGCEVGGGDTGVTGNERKRPRLKSPDDSGAQPDPNSLLAIGLDGISHAVAFLTAKDMCRAEMSGKTLRQVAGPLLNRLIDDMHKRCDCVSEGKGSRTKLLRYLGAKELADQVRQGLDDHQINSHEFSQPCKCRGCNSFPQMINQGILDADCTEHEFFICCLVGRECKFQGFVPMERDWQITNNIVGDLYPSNWAEVDHLLSVNVNSDDEDWWRKFEAVASSKLSIIAIAVHRNSGAPHFLGAASDFSQQHNVIADHRNISADPAKLVHRDVHAQTPISNDGTVAGRMSLDIETENYGSKGNGPWLQLVLWRDE